MTNLINIENAIADALKVIRSPTAIQIYGFLLELIAEMRRLEAGRADVPAPVPVVPIENTVEFLRNEIGIMQNICDQVANILKQPKEQTLKDLPAHAAHVMEVRTVK